MRRLFRFSFSRRLFFNTKRFYSANNLTYQSAINYTNSLHRITRYSKIHTNEEVAELKALIHPDGIYQQTIAKHRNRIRKIIFRLNIPALLIGSPCVLVMFDSPLLYISFGFLNAGILLYMMALHDGITYACSDANGKYVIKAKELIRRYEKYEY